MRNSSNYGIKNQTRKQKFREKYIYPKKKKIKGKIYCI